MAAGTVAGAFLPSVTRAYSYRLEVERKTLFLPRWEANGFKVALLSDFHMNSRPETKRALESVRLAIGLKPDLIVLGGDYVDFRHPSIMANVDRLVEACDDATCPVVAVMGNHDYWSTVPRRVVEAFRGRRARMLLNETVDVDGVTVAGLDDAIQRQQRYDFFPRSRVSGSLLAVLHEPDFVKDMPDHVSLQLSGHSHGGQVCLPFGKSLYTPYGARNYISGHYPDARVPLYVSRGVGTTGPDYRLFCPPEVTLLELRGA